MVEQFSKGRLKVKVSDTRAELGDVASREAADYIKKLMKNRDDVNIIFASAPSQNEFLAGLLASGVDWSRVNAFHMDEYVGIDPRAPQAFGQFLRDRIFSKTKFKSTNYIDSLAEDRQQECDRYARLLRGMPVDIVFLGIGENGHLAFNDPHVAFFDDPLSVKVIDLAHECRNQQINDGCFKTLDEVPTHAYTITIPELLFADKLYAIVPSKAKADAIKATCDGPITTGCPASILRTHKDCTLFADRDSAMLVTR